MLLDSRLSQQHSHPLLSRSIKFLESRLSRDSARALSSISAKYKVLNASGQKEESPVDKKKKKKTDLDGFKEPDVVLFDKSFIPETWTFIKPIGMLLFSHFKVLDY
jgi:hypothetical protein